SRCFFFHAEDGIRNFHVTGVQTCALPILAPTTTVDLSKPSYRFGLASIEVSSQQDALDVKVTTDRSQYAIREQAKVDIQVLKSRSEERRVGKEWRSGAGAEKLRRCGAESR